VESITIEKFILVNFI